MASMSDETKADCLLMSAAGSTETASAQLSVPNASHVVCCQHFSQPVPTVITPPEQSLWHESQWTQSVLACSATPA